MITVLTYVSLVLQAFFRQKRHYNFPLRSLDSAQVDGNHLKIYNYGQAAFDDMLAAIDAAQHSIYLETYIFKGDAIGERFKRHLIIKAQEGVQVYIGFDGFGSLFMPFAFKKWPGKIKVSVYGPLHNYLSFLWLANYTRYHRKILVVDHHTAFLGGMNIGQEYATTWRDTHCRIIGPEAREVALAFAELWNLRHPVRKRLHIKLPYRADSSPGEKLFCRESKPSRVFGPITIRETYLEAIKQSRHNILITNPYFLPGLHIFEELINALNRGVKLQVIVPKKSNHAIVDLLARKGFDELIKAGASIWLYEHTLIHAKTATIDDGWSTIGSANLDGRSQINHEINLFVLDSPFAMQMKEMFMEDLTNCVLASKDEFARADLLRKILETLARPLYPFI